MNGGVAPNPGDLKPLSLQDSTVFGASAGNPFLTIMENINIGGRA